MESYPVYRGQYLNTNSIFCCKKQSKKDCHCIAAATFDSVKRIKNEDD